MTTTSMLENLYAYSDWASGKLFALCHGLSDEQLDASRELGFGSLRNTLFHILAAEEIWLERWQAVPWRPFPMDAAGCSLDEMTVRLERADAARQALIDRLRADDWQSMCEFKDSKGTPYRFPMKDLLWQVANHGIHHRSQALNFLRTFERKVAGGLDYIFFRLAHPTVAQDPAVVEGFRGYGLELATSPGQTLIWDRAFVRRYFEYADWANQTLLELTEPLDDDQLDRSRVMGLDTLRKTATHIFDAENWWLKNWTTGPAPFEKLSPTTPIAELREQWRGVIAERNRFIESLDAAGAARVVSVLVGASPVNFGVDESLLQLCGHGTHHRAQWVNMLRHSQASPPNIDVIFWLRR